MRLDDIDYIRLVVADFKRKQQDSERPLLATFTRRSIRQQCINVLDERKKIGENIEANILQAFFGVPTKGQDLRTLIEFYPLDKFRSLENLMRGKIQTADWANIELLAWLIDFKHRPYSTGMNVLLNEEEMAVLKKSKVKPIDSTPSTIEKGKSETKSKESSEGEKSGGKRVRVIVIAGLLLVVTLSGAYTIWKDKSAKQAFYGKVNTGCMYWADDHYEEVPCNEEREGRMLLPINEERMKHFKRIMQPDTITEWSIGKIYYIKKNKVIEYYTKGGNHPVETIRSLRKLSRYMFDKYLNKKLMSNDDLVSDEGAKFSNNR